MQLSNLGPSVLGVASSTAWGGGDFCGGLAARRSNVFGVVAAAYSVGLALLLAAALLRHDAMPPHIAVYWALGAGAVGGLALSAFYSGLAAGQMGVVAAIAGVLTAAIPVVFNVFLQGLPRFAQAIGFVLAAVAIWLVSRPQRGEGLPRGLGLALLSGTGFGLFLILIRQASLAGGFWPLVISRATSIASVFAITRLLGKFAWPGRESAVSTVLAGIFDTAGLIFYAVALPLGRLDVVAVLSSLYPVVTVVLARVYLQEHLTKLQWLGMFIGMVSVVLVAF